MAAAARPRLEYRFYRPKWTPGAPKPRSPGTSMHRAVYLI
jgi:hypothetical protein